jgi:hypothetical protein
MRRLRSSSDSSNACGLKKSDRRLKVFAELDLDVKAIIRWANHDDPIIRRNRTQFLDIFPLLVPMLVFHEEDPLSELIIGWIDRGEALIDNIASLFNVKRSTMKYLAGYRCRGYPGSGSRQLGGAVTNWLWRSPSMHYR